MNPTSRLRRLGVVALAALALTSACSSGTPKAAAAGGNGGGAFPVTLHSGTTAVTLRTRPTHIVSLSPTATEMLFALGAGAQVKAVDKNSDYPAAAPHTTLDAYNLNAEAVAGYAPDLVVTSGLTAAQTAQLTKLGLTVLDEPAATDLAQSYQQITQLGQATGQVAGAAALVARMKNDVAAVVAATPKPAAGTKYYYELDQTYYSVTSSTFVGQLLSLLGLTSIADAAHGAAAAGGYPQLNSEFVLHASPAYVFLADTKCCGQTVASVGARPGWSALAAVRGGRVVPLDDDIASRWGPRVVDLLRAVSNAMRAHPAGS